MTDDDTMQRAYKLVEELRAEVDFEIDDVISGIIRNLPEEYFRSLGHEDQLTHLKSLLAISICNLNMELMLRSEDGRHIAVVARQNYPGLLAKIVERLPDDQPLINAKIFTAKTHDFIIDLFEFKPTNQGQHLNGPSKLEIEDLIQSVARAVNQPPAMVAEFVSHFDPTSQVLQSADEVREHFLVFHDARDNRGPMVRLNSATNQPFAKFTVAAGSITARKLFLKIAQFLGTRHLDVEQAFLDDLVLQDDTHIATSSFLVAGNLEGVDQVAQELKRFLTEN